MIIQDKINGQGKRLHNIHRLGAILMTLGVAVSSAHAVSASRTVSVGNSIFGATATASFNDYASGSLYRATVAARADGKVLTRTLPLASGTSSLQIQRPSNCHAYGNVKLGGITMTSWNRYFSGAASFATAPFVKTLIGGSTRIWVGPIPVTLKASARASIYAKGSVSVTLSPSTDLPVVRGKVGPVMDAAGVLSAGVDLWLAGADLSGSITIVGVGLTGDITYTSQLNRNPYVSYRATADIFSTDGAIKVCAWIDPPFVSRSEWCRTVYQYSGAHSSYVIASGGRQL